MKLHTLKGYIQNVFLVEYEHGLLLLDGCCRADIGMLCDFIRSELKRPLSDLQLIVVTHMHPDHAGGAHKLRNLTGAKIAAHPKASGWYGGLVGKVAHLTDVVLTYWVAGRLQRPKKHIWYTPTLRPDVLLTDEQSLPGFEDWQVLYTPGHTDHDISLWHADSQQLYVADLVVMVKKQLVPPFPVCHPNQYRRSLHKVARLDSPKILFAHLKPRKLSQSEFQELIAKAPPKPKNMWLSTKARVRHTLGFD